MNHLNEIIGTIATVLAVIGVIKNNKRLRACFLFWLVSNALTGAVHVQASIWSLVIRDVIFFALAIDGWVKWGKNGKKENVADSQAGIGRAAGVG